MQKNFHYYKYFLGINARKRTRKARRAGLLLEIEITNKVRNWQSRYTYTTKAKSFTSNIAFLVCK